jgi:transposase
MGISCRMATTSKSPRMVLLVAYETARRSLKAYPHKFAPKRFTQHQLFACLVLKVHQKKDYRGIMQLLADCADLREAIGLKSVPHYTTLQKAAGRLLRDQDVRNLLQAAVQLQRPKRRVKHSAADSTGIETHHASRYFISRSHRTKDGKQPKKPVSYRRYGKLMILICCASHLILAANASAGPTPDIDQLAPLLDHLPRGVRIERLVADAGFDSAYNHRLLREEHGIVSTIPAAHGRPSKDPQKLPADKYRRLMKTRFNAKAYRRRPQVETAMSMMKRNLGDCLRGRTYQSRRRDMLLMALTHNIAILLHMVWKEVFYRAGRDGADRKSLIQKSR